MSQEVAVISQNQLQDWNQDRLDLLKRTLCPKDITNDEFSIFAEVAKRSGLNPFARQIHAVKRGGKMSIQTGIDGYRLIADRTGAYAGSDDPVFDNEKTPNKAVVTVYKLVGGVRCAFTASARWDEYCPKDNQDFMWKKMPCVMLGKCAEALALRKAFPAELSGLYTNEEMEQAGSGVRPEQPGPDDGDQTPSHWTFPMGKFKQKSLEEVYNDPKNGPKALASYVVYLEGDAQKKNVPLSAKAQDVVDRISEFLGTMENQVTQQPELSDSSDTAPF